MPPKISRDLLKNTKSGSDIIYNIGGWDGGPLGNYGKYKSFNAVEIGNYECFEQEYYEYNETRYDEVLRKGQRIYCVSADDNHKLYSLDCL